MRLALEALLQRPLSRTPGFHARDLMEAADRGEVDALLCLGGNLFGANPDSTQARRALGQIDTIAYLATKPNQGHFHGLGARQTLLLPVFNRFETPHRTTVESGNNWVRFNEPGSSHLKRANLTSEVGFLAELAHRIFGDEPIHWKRLQDPIYVRELIARTVPGYEEMAGIDETNREFQVSGRIFPVPRFATLNGKAQLSPTPMPELTIPDVDHFGGLADGERGFVLNLITARSNGQHNTVVYKAADRYRGMPHRQTLLVNPEDLQTFGFEAHDRVTVQGEAGSLEQIELIPGSIRQGCGLMFFPEANVLMSGVSDQTCGTPAFKRVPVLIRSQVLASMV
jgi:anaerobic selenocysteine-containing dehydrogenase